MESDLHQNQQQITISTSHRDGILIFIISSFLLFSFTTTVSSLTTTTKWRISAASITTLFGHSFFQQSIPCHSCKSSILDHSFSKSTTIHQTSLSTKHAFSCKYFQFASHSPHCSLINQPKKKKKKERERKKNA